MEHSDERWKEPFGELGKALETIENILLGKETGSERVLRDALIQRFEFSFELFWKSLMLLCASEGIQAKSPKAVLKEAYKLEWLDSEEIWLDMLISRNLTSHTYKQVLALEISQKIPEYYSSMKEVYERLKNIYLK